MSDFNLSDPFWLEDPKVLLKWEFFPTQEMTNAERLNALTRLLFIVVLGLYFVGYQQYLTVLILGLLLIIILRSAKRENFSPHRGNHDPCHTCGFDSTLPYINSKYETTPQNQWSHLNDGTRSYTHAHYRVIPVDTPAPYRESWRSGERFCNEFSQYPQSYDITPYRLIQPEPICYFPDQEWVDNTPTGMPTPGKVSALATNQSAFMRDTTEYRNNILGQYVDQFAQERNHLCPEFKPGRKTW